MGALAVRKGSRSKSLVVVVVVVVTSLPLPCAGQVSTLTKLLKHEKTPALRNLVLLPLLVQQDADPDLQVCMNLFW